MPPPPYYGGMGGGMGQGQCKICSGNFPQNCPEEMCTADVQERAQAYTWECDP